MALTYHDIELYDIVLTSAGSGARRLVDGYRLVIFPAVLGRGTRLFADGTPPSAMRLTDTRTAGRGIVMHAYDAAGPLAFGSVSPEEASG